MLVCCISCVGCRPEPETATPGEKLTVSELEDLLRKKKNNTTKPPVNKVAEPLSPEKKDGSYSLKAPPNKRPQSKVSSDGRTFDWGSVMQGEVVTHDFEIRNSGPTPLIIEDVKPACGCTTGSWDKTIAPGATGKITLSVDTLRFAGRIKKTAQVITNASKGDKTTLVMQGDIEVVIIQEPPPGKRGLTAVPGVPIKPVTITLKKGSVKTFKLNKVSCPNRQAGRGSPPLVDIRVSVIEAGSHYELIITPHIPPDNDTIRFYTANIVANVTVRGKTFDLPVNLPIGVKKRIDWSPQSILFTNKDFDELDVVHVDTTPATKEVRIMSLHPDHSFNILGVRIEGEHLKTSLETVTPGKEYKLAIELVKKPKTTGPRRIVEKIFVDTDDEDPTLHELTIQAVLHRLTRPGNKSPPLIPDLNGGTKTTNVGPVSPPEAIKPKGKSK
jgi:hypothetical protein